MSDAPPSLWPVLFRLATKRDWPPREEDLDPFFELARRENLLPLLLADDALPPVVAGAKRRFLAYAPFFRRRYELARDALIRFLEIVPPDSCAVLKGNDYRHRLYSRPELRPANDVDVFVPRRHLRAVLAALHAAGHAQKYSQHGAVWAPGYYEIAFEVRDTRVEIHRSFGQPVKMAVDFDALWERCERFDGARRLAIEDAIAYHAVNLAKDEFSAPLIRYVDFYHLLTRYADALPAAVERAKRWQTERALYGAMRVTSRLFPELDLRDAMSALATPRVRALLDRRVLPDPTQELSGHTSGRFLQLWRKYWLIDRVWRRAAFVGYHVYATLIGSAVEISSRRGKAKT